MARPRKEHALTPAERSKLARERRVTETPTVTETVTKTPESVTETVFVASPVTKTPTRVFLRAELDRLRDAFGGCQRRQDWAGCKAINEEREPLFHQLWGIERTLPESGRYWFPARILNEGVDHGRKALSHTKA